MPTTKTAPDSVDAETPPDAPQAPEPSGKTTKLVYIGIHDEVFMPALDNLVAVRGEPVDVPSGFVGSAPKGTPGDEDYSPGEGLLAQVENWTKPGTKAAKNAPPAVDTPVTSTPVLEDVVVPFDPNA
jgi:transposase